MNHYSPPKLLVDDYPTEISSMVFTRMSAFIKFCLISCKLILCSYPSLAVVRGIITIKMRLPHAYSHDSCSIGNCSQSRIKSPLVVSALEFVDLKADFDTYYKRKRQIAQLRYYRILQIGLIVWPP